MKTRIIKYLEKYYCITLNIIYILLSGLFLLFSIKNEVYVAIFIFTIIIVCFVALSIVFYNYNIVFNYTDEIIKVLEPGHFRASTIKMSEIKIIKFYEVKTERKKNRLLHEMRLLYNFDHIYVYNHGKKYSIEIIKKNETKIKISYDSLYRCKNENTIILFENKMNDIIKEFNDFKYKNYFRK